MKCSASFLTRQGQRSRGLFRPEKPSPAATERSTHVRYRVFGIALAVLGVVAATFLRWFGPLTGGPEPPLDLFEAVERRVRAGMLLGVGLCFVAITALRPWSTSIPMAIFCFMTGALAARLLGLLVDGTVPKQWLLVAVEAAAMAVAALWLWRSSGSAP